MCSKHHAVNSTDYLYCLCSGLHTKLGQIKHQYCQLYADGMAQENTGVMHIVFIAVAVALVVFALFLLMKRYSHALIKLCQKIGGGMGCRGGCDILSRMFCCCCDSSSSKMQQSTGVVPNANMAALRRDSCCRCLYGRRALLCVEFICDCDCLHTRRVGRVSHTHTSASMMQDQDTSNTTDQEDHTDSPVQSQPKRCASIRRAPPPPNTHVPGSSGGVREAARAPERLYSRPRAPPPSVPLRVVNTGRKPAPSESDL